LLILLTGCEPAIQPPGSPTVEFIPTPTLEVETTLRLLPRTDASLDALIRTLDQEDQLRTGSDSALHQAFLMALQEALWLFPQSPLSEHWRWLQVRLWASEGASAAAQQAGSLIAEALNTSAASMDHLTLWLQSIEPSGTYTSTSLSTLPGMQDLHLLEFRLTGQPAYYVIAPLQDAYQVSLLASGREFQSNPAWHTHLEWQDLTGDGQAEAWVITTDQNPRLESAWLSLYDLSSGTAQRVVFSPDLPQLPTGSWQILTEEGQPAGLQVGVRLDGGSALCEYLLPVEYKLTDGEYRRTSIEKPDLANLLAAGFSEAQANLCLDLSVDWLRANVNQDEQVSLDLLETLMPGFPYASDAALYVGLYPPDELDRARFELGLNYALRQDPAGAARWMSAVIQSPAFPGSPWQAQAQTFLETYQAEGGLRAACLASGACLGTRRLDFNQVVGLMQAEDWSDPVSYLEQMGVLIVESGLQDFRLDGQPEAWWLESTGGASDTLRIYAQTQGQPWLGRLSLPAAAGEAAIEPWEPLFDQPVYHLRRGTSELSFVYFSADPAQPPAVEELDQYRARMIQTIYLSLLRDGQDTGIFPALADLQASPYFNCNQPTELCRPSAQLAYLSAFSLELSGDPEAAAAAYQQVAARFAGSSYAILAGARLQP
jgi:hypothetical protein